MLRLHGEGVAVTFAKGRPGQPLADVFFVKIEDQDYVRILSEINEALDASAEAAYDKNASIKYADAEAFVEQIREIKELSNEAERDKGLIEQEQPQVPTEPEFTDLQSGKIDVLLCQEDKNGNKKERQLNLPL